MRIFRKPSAAIILLAALSFSLASFAAEPGPLRPFPQHTHYATGSIKPSHVTQAQLDGVTSAFYDSWRKKYLVAGCEPRQFYVLDDETTAANAGQRTITVSEGHGYGMLITAFMAGHEPRAREIFDGLVRYYRAHPSAINPRLMAWNQVTSCINNPDGGNDSATDGDLDIAQALLLADAQWGSQGEINYRAEALALIAAIKKDEINPTTWTVKLGDWSAPKGKHYFGTRPSDFMGDHFRCFQSATGDADWKRVTDTCYRIIAEMQTKHSPSTGLIPDFVADANTTPVPAKAKFLEGAHDGHYSYNSCRVPFRLGVDFLLTGEPRAKVALDRINNWIKSATAGKPDAIRAGYKLDGKLINKDDRTMAFTACFGVGAMSDAAHQEWLNALWSDIAASDSKYDRYFGRTLKMLCLIALSGNWWSPCDTR